MRLYLLGACLLFAGPALGAVRFAAVAFLVTSCLAPRLIVSTLSVPHVGIAGSGLELTTYGAALLVACFLLLRHRLFWTRLRVFAPFVVFALLATSFLWPMTPEREAGVVQLLLGILAWGVGSVVGADAASTPTGSRYLARLIAAIATLECALGILQLAGHYVPHVDQQTAELVEGRVSGTFDHPNNLAKALVLLVALSLAFANAEDRSTRRAARWAAIAAVAPLVLTGGRAATLAGLSTLVLWGVLQPGVRALGRRAMLPAIAAIGGVVFWSLFSARIESDAQGGARSHFMRVALTVLPEHIVSGIGPNSYVSYAGRLDALTAEGWPVHDVFVLAAVELGLLGAALYFLPWLHATLGALRNTRKSGPTGDYARALLCVTPGTILICVTGWGLLAASLLPLWFFTVGFLGSSSGGRAVQGARATRRSPRIVPAELPVATAAYQVGRQPSTESLGIGPQAPSRRQFSADALRPTGTRTDSGPTPLTIVTRSIPS